MALPIPRLFRLAIIATLVALFTGTFGSTLCLAQNKAAATKPAEDPLTVLFTKAMLAMDNKKYDEALKNLDELEKKAPKLETKLAAVVQFKRASCYYLKKDWSKAEGAINLFLTKFPKGTEDFFDINDNKIGVARLTLVEVYGGQSKWEDALKLLSELRSSPLVQPQDRVSAYALSGRIIVEQAKSGTEPEKRKAYGQALELLKKAIAGGLGTPEAREAGNQLVEVYTKLGLVKEAEQLKAEIDSKGSGSPAEIVRANFQRIEIGDARFASAEASTDEKTKLELYRQALASYQGVLRRNNITRSITKALEQKQNELDNLLRVTGTVSDETKAKIETVKAELAQFQKIESEFSKNKDYDALIAYRIGLCLLELKLPWEAFVGFRDIFDNSPNFTKVTGAYYYYILALREIGRNTEAQAKCKEFLQKFPEAEQVSEVAVILGSISQDREEYPEAIEHYKWAKQNVKKMDPSTLEELDFRIAASYFAQVEWEKARVALDEFARKYPKSLGKEQVTYMRALCWFYQGKYKETKQGFDDYQKQYPKGAFLPDVRYRQAIIKYGLNPPEIAECQKICQDWLRDYSASSVPEVQNQVPEIHTLIGDCETRLATDLDNMIRTADNNIKTNGDPAVKKKYTLEKQRLEKEKEVHVTKSIDAYIAAAKTSKTNASALEFVVQELNKLLSGRGEHQKLKNLYQEIYDWDHNSPKAMSYLYEIIKATERMGDKPEFSQRTEATQKKYSALLAVARRKVDDLTKADSTTPGVLAAAKAEVAKLSDALAAELDQIEKDRQVSIQAAKTEALGMLSKSVAESINDRKQEGSEKLIIFLAEKISRKVKRVKPGIALDPKAYTAEKAEQEITQLLKLEQNKDSLIAQARGYFALAQLSTFLRNPEKTDLYFRKISNNYKAEELSSTLLGVVGDHLVAKRNYPAAEGLYQYLLEHHRSSEYADFGFAGMAEVRLNQGKFKEALDLCNEATDNNIVMSKEKDIKFAHARALAELGRYEEARKGFEEIVKTKEWKGETTAGCLYWIGQMEERQGNSAEAVAFYRRCYQTWKKYEFWSAKAYLGTAKILAGKLNQKPEAKLLLAEMLSKDRIKETPEAKEAKILMLSL